MSRMIFKYKEHNTLEQRRSHAETLRLRHPDSVPVLLEQLPGSPLPSFETLKFLIKKEMSVAHFIWFVRLKIEVQPETALFFFVGKVLPQNTATMGQIDEQYRDEDGFLYVACSSENTFGQWLVTSMTCQLGCSVQILKKFSQVLLFWFIFHLLQCTQLLSLEFR